MSAAEQQYRSLQQQHESRLQAALEDRDRQLVEGKELFDRLKQDFKYNLRLLQERDEELTQSDVTLAQLREQLSQNLVSVSDLGVEVHEWREKCRGLGEETGRKEKAANKQLERERAEFDRKLSDKLAEHGRERLEWEALKRSLDERLKVCDSLLIIYNSNSVGGES